MPLPSLITGCFSAMAGSCADPAEERRPGLSASDAKTLRSFVQQADRLLCSQEDSVKQLRAQVSLLGDFERHGRLFGTNWGPGMLAERGKVVLKAAQAVMPMTTDAARSCDASRRRASYFQEGRSLLEAGLIAADRSPETWLVHDVYFTLEVPGNLVVLKEALLGLQMCLEDMGRDWDFRVDEAISAATATAAEKDADCLEPLQAQYAELVRSATDLLHRQGRAMPTSHVLSLTAEARARIVADCTERLAHAHQKSPSRPGARLRLDRGPVLVGEYK